MGDEETSGRRSNEESISDMEDTNPGSRVARRAADGPAISSENSSVDASKVGRRVAVDDLPSDNKIESIDVLDPDGLESPVVAESESSVAGVSEASSSGVVDETVRDTNTKSASSATAVDRPKSNNNLFRFLQIFGILLVIVSVIAGIFLWVDSHRNVYKDAPQLAESYASPGQAPNNTDGEVQVNNSAKDGDPENWSTSIPIKTMSKERMANMSVFSPQGHFYSQITGTDQFLMVHQGDLNLNSIKLARNPYYTTWYNKGGAIAGGEKGTTFLASHIVEDNHWGPFTGLTLQKAGDIIWTRDAAGNYQSWMVVHTYQEDLKEFPKDFWDNGGDPRLILTTCGGNIVNGHFTKNQFVVATPYKLQ